MSKNKLGQDSPFPKFLHLRIRRRNGVESLTTLEEGEFKFAIDGCIKTWNCFQLELEELFDPIVLRRIGNGGLYFFKSIF